MWKFTVITCQGTPVQSTADTTDEMLDIINSMPGKINFEAEWVA